MKTKLLNLALVALLSAGMMACSDKKSEGAGGGEPEQPGDVSGSMEELSPLESKKFLEGTANEFIEAFQAKDQKALIDLCAYFGENYGHLAAPDNFTIDEREEIIESNPGYFMRGLMETFGNGNPTRAASTLIQYFYTLDFDKFKGIYENGTSKWVQTGSSNDIIFRFPGNGGQSCELVAKLSGSNSEGEIVITDEDYWYDEVYEDHYSFKIPKEIDVTLTQGGTALVTGKLYSDLDVKSHKYSVNVNLTAMNVNAAYRIDANDSQVSGSASLTVSGKNLISSSAKINGNKLCDIDNYLSMDMETGDALASLLKSGEASMSVLNKVRVDAKATYNTALYEAFATDYDDYEFDSKYDAEKAIEKAIDTIEKNVEALVRYNNKETVQAKLVWGYEEESYGYWWQYRLVPQMQFISDGSVYDFGKYFSSGFSSVESAWQDLLESYQKVWEQAVKNAK